MSLTPISVDYFLDWERVRGRFTVELLTERDLVKKVSWEQLIENSPDYKVRMLLGLNDYFTYVEPFDGHYHQYSAGVPVFHNSLAVLMRMNQWDYLMQILPR